MFSCSDRKAILRCSSGDQLDQAAEASAKAIQPPDRKRVAGAQVVEALLQVRAVAD
jgi:hypothetical protein